MLIRTLNIENYKSIQHVKLDLGRVTVLIGENGCGKSNLLEAIALFGASLQNRLDNEFLSSRGIRVTEPHWMRNASEAENQQHIQFSVVTESLDDEIRFALSLGRSI